MTVPPDLRPAQSYTLIELSTGKVVKTGPSTAWNGGKTDQASGDKVWWFDFSEVEAPGRYAVVDIEKGIRSADFSIGEHVYKDVMKHAVRTFFYQRAGFEKKPEFAGKAWADKASHLGPGQDSETRPWHEGRPSNPAKSLIKDLRGGWYDAGDFNKYTSWAARYIIALLQAYEEHPQAFSDDYGIPESGNGIPDILDEVKWGLDWLVRMQNADGSLLCVQGLASASPPSDARGNSYYGPPTTSATLMGAAAFAYASKFFASRPEPDLKQYGDDLKKRATAAWTWATANPNVLYYNNDNSKQPGSKGLAAGQQEMSETDRLRAQFEAATYLFEMTGEAQFKQFADANYGALLPPWGPSMWEVDALDSLLYYARLPGATPEVAKSIRERLLVNLSRASQAFQSLSGASGSLSRPDEGLHVGQQQGKGHAGKVVPIGGPARHGSKAVRDFARRGVGVRALSPWRKPARPRLSDEHGPGRRQSFRGDDVSFLVCPRHALATGDRAASGATAGLPGRRAQSAVLDRFMLQRASRVARLPLLRCADVRVVPAQFQAAVGAAARQVVSSVQ